MSSFTVLGDGLLTLGTVPNDFSGEVLGASISHDYESVGEARTMLDGSIRPAGQRRADGFTASLENDLSATGFYQFLVTSDGQEVAFTFTPNTVDGASWAGTVIARLPGSVGADSYGSPIVSEVELVAVGTFTFTAATVSP